MTTMTTHPALAYCQQLWPSLDWHHDSQGPVHLIWADTPANLQIRLEIMGDRGAMAMLRTNQRYSSGIIFKRSQDRLGVPWQEAVDEIAQSLKVLSNAIQPASNLLKDGAINFNQSEEASQ